MFSDSQPASSLRGFEILRRLGVGGAGEVFLARSKGGRLVAIKTLAGAAEDATFAREAALCARLIHPAIVQVRAFFDDPGAPALVFDYVPGVALSRLLRFCATHRVRLPDEPAWHVVERVLSALAYAHAQKDSQQQPTPIVHRDVSPANVLVDWNGGEKLADLGIAKMLGVSPATRVGLVKGTPGCMAPEQARGEPVTERADVYAGALLAWRLATGRVPFAKYANDELELLRAMRNPRIKSLSVLRPDLPAPLADAIDVALRADPEQRKITAEELAVTVRASFDLAGGRIELAALLTRWKPALERSVRRGGGVRALRLRAPRRRCATKSSRSRSPTKTTRRPTARRSKRTRSRAIPRCWPRCPSTSTTISRPTSCPTLHRGERSPAPLRRRRRSIRCARSSPWARPRRRLPLRCRSSSRSRGARGAHLGSRLLLR